MKAPYGRYDIRINNREEERIYTEGVKERREERMKERKEKERKCGEMCSLTSN